MDEALQLAVEKVALLGLDGCGFASLWASLQPHCDAPPSSVGGLDAGESVDSGRSFGGSNQLPDAVAGSAFSQAEKLGAGPRFRLKLDEPTKETLWAFMITMPEFEFFERTAGEGKGSAGSASASKVKGKDKSGESIQLLPQGVLRHPNRTPLDRRRVRERSFADCVALADSLIIVASLTARALALGLAPGVWGKLGFGGGSSISTAGDDQTSAMQFCMLEELGRSAETGVTQLDLARRLESSPKGIFHVMKLLYVRGLIAMHIEKVSAKATLTVNRFWLQRFAPP